MVFSVLSLLRNLKKLNVSQIQAHQQTNIEILNNNLSKSCQIEDLHINFKHSPTEKSSLTPIKFPKYLKKLKAMTLENVWHKEFAETLFDMAS